MLLHWGKWRESHYCAALSRQQICGGNSPLRSVPVIFFLSFSRCISDRGCTVDVGGGEEILASLFSLAEPPLSLPPSHWPPGAELVIFVSGSQPECLGGSELSCRCFFFSLLPSTQPATHPSPAFPCRRRKSHPARWSGQAHPLRWSQGGF